MTSKYTSDEDDPGVQRNIRIRKSNLDPIEELKIEHERSRDYIINKLLRLGLQAVKDGASISPYAT